MDKDNDNDNKYRILNEIHSKAREVPEYSGLYSSMSTAVDLYTVQVVKHLILQ